MIDMYAKSGSLQDAYVVFRTMNVHTLASWNVMISGFSQHRYFGEVLRFFRQMLSEGFQPDDYTLVVILRACIDTEALQFGQSLHDFLIRSSTLTGVYVTNALMAMYAKCKCIEDANTVFRLASERDLVTWNTMIGGHLENGQNTKSLELFQCMRTQGVKPDRATFIGVLKACIALDSLDMGKMVHACFIEDEDSQCILLMSTLVDMYTKCGSTEDARRIFNKMRTRNAILWNIMLAGYSHSVEEAVKLFEQMEGDSLKPDEVTFLNLLKGCQTEEHLEFCQLIHNCCIEYGHETDLYIGSCLVDVYCTCGRLIEAWRVFEVMPERNVVSWNAIVTGCAERGDGEDVLELYEQMQVEGLHAEDITYVSVFNACAETTNFKQGRIIHSLILFSGREQNLFVDNALVDMYGKCGVLCEAFKVFRNMPVKDIVSWNALISCYAQHGYGTQTLGLAQDMIREGISFNEVTLLGILTACSYAGFIEEAQTYFNTMYRSHGVIPTSEHYACMVDVYGRAGLLDEAAQFIKQLPIEPTSVIWMALLAASRTCGSTILALHAAAQVSLTDPQNSAAFLMLSSLRRCKQWDAAITCE
ncbi:hypothetical protein KP509_12G018600 [Ceratopteris richardii]|nr:hypothetical protein KP509_12G018600 [Ceratopteris richardii]